MTDPLYMSDRQVAEMLGVTRQWFSQNHARLELNHGFPKRDPAFNKRSRSAVLTWHLSRDKQTMNTLAGGQARIK